MNRVTVRLGLVALTALLASLPLFAHPAMAAPQQVYIALGDSIAAGLVTTLPRDRGYPALVAGLLGKSANGPAAGSVRLINLGVPGETATSFLEQGQHERFANEVAAAQDRGDNLRAVTVSLGGNDLLRLSRLGTPERQSGLDQFRQTFPSALSSIRAALRNTQPVLVVTTYYDLSEGDPQQQGSDAWWLQQFNQVIRETAQAQGARVADLEPVFRGHIHEWTWQPTDVHPNNEGHAQIARLVWQAMGIDTQAPEISIERPGGGALDRPIPTIRASVSDNIGVERVELLVDGQHNSDLIYIARQGVYTGIWDGRHYAGAGPTFTVRALDRAGNEATMSVSATMPGT